jgi:hypothetical protein
MVETMDQKELEQAKEGVRLTQLEIDTKIIKTDLKVLRDNHVHHLAQDMEKMDKKIDKLDTRVYQILFSIIILAASNVIAAFFN